MTAVNVIRHLMYQVQDLKNVCYLSMKICLKSHVNFLKMDFLIENILIVIADDICKYVIV